MTVMAEALEASVGPVVESAAPAASTTAVEGGGAAGASRAPGSAAPSPRSGAAPRSSSRPAPRKAAPAPVSRGRGAGPKRKGKSANPFAAITKPVAGANKLVLAEFVICVILVGVGPIFTRKPKGGHLYQAADFVRLSAISLLFFVLALVSNNERSATIAASFGGLVTLGVAYNSLPAATAVGALFTNTQAAKAAGTPQSEPAAGTTAYHTADYAPKGPAGDPSANAGTKEVAETTTTTQAPTQSSSGGGTISV